MSQSASEKLRRFYGQFSGSDHVLIVINADPDAIASAMAVSRLLWRKVISVTISHINTINRPDNLAMKEAFFIQFDLEGIEETERGFADFLRIVAGPAATLLAEFTMDPDSPQHLASTGAGVLGAGVVDGELVDLRTRLVADSELRIITVKDPEAGDVIRHSAEHVMADAVKRLFPSAQIDVGRTDHSVATSSGSPSSTSASSTRSPTRSSSAPIAS